MRPENRTLGKLRSFINGFSPYPQPQEKIYPEQKEEKYHEQNIDLEQKEEEKDIVVEMKAVNINVEDNNLKTESDRKVSDEVSSDNLLKIVELNPKKVQMVENKENQEV